MSSKPNKFGPARHRETPAPNGGQLTLSWPADHTGWTLQSNAVDLGASSQWYPVPGSAATNQVIITPDPTQANVFYRLLYQVP